MSSDMMLLCSLRVKKAVAQFVHSPFCDQEVVGSISSQVIPILCFALSIKKVELELDTPVTVYDWVEHHVMYLGHDISERQHLKYELCAPCHVQQTSSRFDSGEGERG